MMITAHDLPTAPWHVVFLDVDGVLNREVVGAPELEPRLLALLSDLLARTGAVVVLTSSWRYDRTPAEMQAMLTAAGCPAAVVGATPTALEDVNVPWGSTRERGDEIMTWLEEHPGLVASYVVLDDMDDMRGVTRRLVRTDSQVGLTSEHAERAVRMLLEDA